MKLSNIGWIVSIAAGVVAIWWYLRNTPSTNLVTYPNTQASGQPASQNAASVYNIAAPSPMPSPNLIYGPPPPLPPTPGYMSFNNSPVNVLGLTPQGALTAQGKQPKSGCCDDSCGCASCSNGGTYQDGNLQACVVSNPAEQVRSGSADMYAAVAANIASSSVGPQPIGLGIPSAQGNPVQDATVIPSQRQGLAQVRVAQPVQDTPKVLSSSLLTWAQYGTLTAINSGVSETVH